MKKFKILFALLAVFLLVFTTTISVSAAESQIENELQEEIRQYVADGELEEWHLDLMEWNGYIAFYNKCVHFNRNFDRFAEITEDEMWWYITMYQNHWDETWEYIIDNLDIWPEYLEQDTILGLYWDSYFCGEEDEGYFAKYENGKEMFILELEDLLGLEINPEEYIRELDRAVQKTSAESSAAQQVLISKYSIKSWSQLESIINKNVIHKGTPEEMIVYLKEFAKTIVPDLQTDPDIVIKEMDEASAKASNAVAYYMKSAVDSTASEYITLNPDKLKGSTKNDVLSTLAHEGYPGHLYAYLYSKELGLSNIATIMTSTAHGEGWATYVSIKLFEYAMERSDNDKFKEVMAYLRAN